MYTSHDKNLVKTEQQGKVFLIGLNRPEKRNAVNPATAQQLRSAFQHFETNNDLAVAVLYGNGGTFCGGWDLSTVSEISHNGDQDVLPESETGNGPMGPSRRMFSKPVIAAVSGYAVAGGLELTLMCDMRVAEKSATFGVYCRRFGVPLIDGGTVRLPHLIGLSRALDMILTGRPVRADEALMFGLVNRVVQDGTALKHAVQLAENIAKFPQECMRRDRLSAYNAMYNATSLGDALKFEWENAKHVLAQESVEGAQKFVDGIGRGGTFDLTKKSKL